MSQNRVPEGVPTGGQFAASVRSETVVALSPHDDPRAHFANVTEEASAPIMGDVYSILHERETIPEDYLVDHVTVEDAEADFEKFIGPAIDGLEHEYVNIGDPDRLLPGVDEHVKRVCKEAGLETMAEFYGVLGDRDTLTGEAALDITAEDVARDYETYVAPAIDRLQASLARSYTYDAAEGTAGDLDELSAELSAMFEDPDLAPELDDFDNALEAAWDEFDDADGGSEALRTYAQRLENEAVTALRASADRSGYGSDALVGAPEQQWDREMDRARVRLKKAATSLVISAENIADAED